MLPSLQQHALATTRVPCSASPPHVVSPFRMQAPTTTTDAIERARSTPPCPCLEPAAQRCMLSCLCVHTLFQGRPFPIRTRPGAEAPSDLPSATTTARLTK